MLILRIILTSELLPKLMLYRVSANYYTRRFLVVTRSQSFSSEDPQRILWNWENGWCSFVWGGFLEYLWSWHCMLQPKILCTDHSLRSHDLTVWKILNFLECRLFSLGSSKRENLLSVFWCRHCHSEKQCWDWRQSQNKPHFGPSHICVPLYLVSNRSCVLCTVTKNHRSYTWPDLLGHLISPPPSAQFCWMIFGIIREDNAKDGTD